MKNYKLLCIYSDFFHFDRKMNDGKSPKESQCGYIFIFVFLFAVACSDSSSNPGEEDPQFESYSWTQVTQNAEFSERFSHTATVFEDKIWVIGGNNGNRINDVWYSTDGKNWIEATGDPGFSNRHFHSSVAFDNKIWVIGGIDFGLSQDTIPSSSDRNDTWHSSDGIHWELVSDNPEFSLRQRHCSVVFDNKIWVIGGLAFTFDENGWEGFENTNDVWYTQNGSQWTQATEHAAFPGRNEHTCLVFDDKIWIIGGRGEEKKKDVWFSSDGVNWTEATPDIGFLNNYSEQIGVTFDNKMWVMNFSISGDLENNLWYSYDGIEWLQADQEVVFPPRRYPALTVFQNKLWLIGGSENLPQNDVWYLE